MDPGFDCGVALARVNGRLVIRLANADVLPFEFTALAYGEAAATGVADLRPGTAAAPRPSRPPGWRRARKILRNLRSDAARALVGRPPRLDSLRCKPVPQPLKTSPSPSIRD